MGIGMRRKCAILQDTRHSPVPLELLPTKAMHLGRDSVDRSKQFAAFVDLLRNNGVDITRTMPGQRYVFGWVERDHIPHIRALPEVAAINDDYAYLVQDED